MFDIDRFVEECRAARKETDSIKAVRELVAREVADPNGIMQALGEPTKGGVNCLHRSDDLTVINLVWAPRMTLMPHNHNMWAVIGVYTGREDNIFWRRVKDDPDCHIEAAGAESLGPGDVAPLGKNIIHSVTNPTGILTSALHVYGGDFYGEHRSEWDPESLTERPFDFDHNLKLFEQANAQLAA